MIMNSRLEKMCEETVAAKFNLVDVCLQGLRNSTETSVREIYLSPEIRTRNFSDTI
jgi:hypothetical protein